MQAGKASAFLQVSGDSVSGEFVLVQGSLLSAETVGCVPNRGLKGDKSIIKHLLV